MNRQQAENMLDAYVEIHNTYKRGTMSSVSVDKALESMREVILDAMTATSHSPMPNPWWGNNGITVKTKELGLD